MSCLLGRRSEPLYIILPYFNFCGFQRRRELFLEFVERYRDEPLTKLVVVEALGPAPLGRIKGVTHLTLRSKSTVWLKENLINLGVESLPRSWKYVAWIDADLEFLNQNWVRDAISELQDADVVQMWRSAINLGPNGETIKTDKSFAYMFVGSQTAWSPTDKYGFWHPGYAWACTRSAYERMGGLVEWAILGSGDRHMAMAFAGLALQSCPGNVHENYKGLLRIFESRVKDFKVSWVDGTIVHHWHGSFANRRYKERWDILTKNAYDPAIDVEMTRNGVIQLTKHGQRFEKFLNEYFIGRREDSRG
jgi:hypothetical protein